LAAFKVVDERSNKPIERRRIKLKLELFLGALTPDPSPIRMGEGRGRALTSEPCPGSLLIPMHRGMDEGRRFLSRC
jgi:hypothetical protein